MAVAQMRECWRIADDAGFDHLWNFDHLSGANHMPEAPILEGWALLAAMAEATSRVRLGCLVTGNTYRYPAVLAKLAVTVDHLSGGRLEFGVGASSGGAEHPMYGIDGFDHRVGRLSESLQILKALWSQERTNFQGRYYQLNDAIANPKPLQSPHPPIWIGAHGEKTLRLVARHADVWNATDSAGGAKSAGAVGRQLLEDLEREGRSADAIRWSAQVFWDGQDRAHLTSQVVAYLEEGFTEIIIFPDVRQSGADPIAATLATAEELAALRTLAPARA
jgi:alkanesulfonate monooxygenase SsuD/methylene tetrahydromethanopterin reductase-like flavin-dependent oxidoreductase (luciferase family)